MIPPSPTRIIEFDRPMEAVGMNQVRSWHWGKLRRHLDPWKQMAQVTWNNQYRRSNTLQAGPAVVQICIPFDVVRRRDPHNYVGTVVKAVIDGLVKAGAWPDDNPKWVRTVEPVLIRGSRVIVNIYEEQPDDSSDPGQQQPSGSDHQSSS